MAALDSALAVKLLSVIFPSGTGGAPATWTALSTNPLKLKLTSSTATATGSDTEITGTGYTAGGTGVPGASSAPTYTGGAATGTCPSSAVSWTNGSGSTWSIQSLVITDGAGTPVRLWFGNFTGAPVSVASGNTFQIAANAITLSIS